MRSAVVDNNASCGNTDFAGIVEIIFTHKHGDIHKPDEYFKGNPVGNFDECIAIVIRV